MNTVPTPLKVVSLCVGLATLTSALLPVSAAPLSISDTPLFLTTQRIYPNLFITMDDSGSMRSGGGRDSINAQYNNKRFKAASYNALYYNPAVTYTPPPKYDGTTCNFDSDPSTCYPNVDFTAAPMNGFDTSRGASQDASSSNCTPKSGTYNYSPVNLEDNYAVVYQYSPDDHTQNCGSSDGVVGSGGETTYTGTTVPFSATCQVDFDDHTSSGSKDRIHIDTNSTTCRSNLFTILAPGGTVAVTHASRGGTYTVAASSPNLDSANYYIYVDPRNPWGSDLNNQSNVTLAPTNHCRVDFINNGSNDYIAIDSTNNACRSTFFTNLGANASLTVSGSGRNGTYTVTSADTGNWRIYVGAQWSSDLTDQPANMSWTRTVETPGATTYPAYYYLFYDKVQASAPSGCSGVTDVNNDSCYIKVVVGSADDIAGKNHAAINAAQKALQKAASATWPWTEVQQKQNFANWYSYYRTRNLTAVSSTMRAFASVDTNVRVGWQGIGDNSPTCNTFGTSCKGWDSSLTDNRVRRLNSAVAGAPSSGRTHKQELYDWLARLPVAGATYLRKSARRVGTHLSSSVDINHPYADDPGFRQFPLNPDGSSRSTYDGCRRNLHLIITDGGWCGDSGSVSVSDYDSSTRTLPVAWPGDTTSPYEWTPTYPYKDKQAETLADIAMYQWVTDAQPTISNTLTPLYRETLGTDQTLWLNPRNDPATWQHINTYTIAFGLDENLNGTPVSGGGTLPIWQGSTFASDPVTGDGYNKLAQGTSCPASTTSATASTSYCWPGVSEAEGCPPSALQQQRKSYDLWHAAINGRGDFFSAESPQDLADAVASVLGQAGAATTSFSALAANSTSLQSDTLLYQGKFDSRDWSGQLLAYPLGAGGVIGQALWDAALPNKMPAPASRHIYTYRDGGSAAFSCAGSLETALDKDHNAVDDGRCEDRIAWMKGDHGDEERNGGDFRNRYHTVQDDTDYDNDGLTWDSHKDQITVEWVLGDIATSNPVYVQYKDYGYGTLAGTEGSSYTTFLTGTTSRQPMVYVGANDGMLHAFSANNDNNGGVEKFAFVPSGVYGNLSKLMNPGYVHEYFVDGSPAVGDAYLSGSWKTVLVSGLGKGGKSVFALNVSDPTTFATTNPALWEFTDTDLGYTFSQPQIGRLKNGKWVAVFGNGYNSTNERAYLFIVNLENPADFKKIAANIGSPVCTTGCANGLSSPLLFDDDNDKSVDYAYAGDLQGNLWRFDLNATASTAVASDAGLAVSFSGAPLFTARNSSNHVQPITARPVVTNTGGKRMVLFGTGQYLTLADVVSTSQQTLYAINDAGSAITTLDRSELGVQTIVTTTTAFGLQVRTTTDTDTSSAKGWYMDLPVETGKSAERVIDHGVLIKDRIAFVTNIPSNDPCTPGGESWLMELNPATGARPSIPVLDINKDNVFDDTDKVGGAPISGVKLGIGLAKPPVVVDSPGESVQYKAISGTLGMGGTTTGKAEANYDPQTTAPATRIYWLQIQ